GDVANLALVPWQRGQQLALAVPQPDGLIGGGGGDPLAVRTEAHGAGCIAVAAHDLEQLPRFTIPKPYEIAGVVFTGKQAILAGTESHARDPVIVVGKDVDQAAIARVPDAHVAVIVAGGGKPLAIRTEGKAIGNGLVSAQDVPFLTAG